MAQPNSSNLVPEADEYIEYYRTEGIYIYRDLGTGTIYGYSNEGDISVFAFHGNKVYMQNTISPSINNSWIEGTVSEDGTKLTFPTEQYITFNGVDKTDMKLCIMKYVNGNATKIESISQFSYTMNKADGTIVLDDISDGTEGLLFISAYSSNQVDYWLWGETVQKFKCLPKTLVTPPTDLKTETWKLNAVHLTHEDATPVEYNIEFGVYGDEAYVKGFFPELPEAWIKGTISGNTCTFTSQYIGEIDGYESGFYFMGLHVNQDKYDYQITFTYNAENNTYTCDDDSYVLLNAKPIGIFYIKQFGNFVISKPEPDAVEGVTDNNTVVSETYTTLSGAKVQNPQHGIFVKSIRYADGTIKNLKVRK